MSANATFHPYPLLACSFPCLAPCSSIRKAFITNLTQKLAILKMCLVMRNAHCHLKKVHGFLLYLFLFFVFSCISRSLSHTFCQSCVVHYCITFRRLSIYGMKHSQVFSIPMLENQCLVRLSKCLAIPWATLSQISLLKTQCNCCLSTEHKLCPSPNEITWLVHFEIDQKRLLCTLKRLQYLG